MKYREQKYSSCQLITAINARIWLGGGDIDDNLFEYLVDLTKCRYGGAISIEEAYPILNLAYEDGPPNNVSWIQRHLPVDLLIRDPILGLHSVLVEKVSFEGKITQPIFHLVNYKGNPKETLTWMELNKIIPIYANLRRCRSFSYLGTCNDHNSQINV